MLKDGFDDEIVAEGNKTQRDTIEEEEETKAEDFGLLKRQKN